MNKKFQSKKSIALLCLALLLALTLTACTRSAAANSDPTKTSAATLSGYLVENDNGSLLVSSEDSGLYFVSAETALVKKGGSELSVSELKPGMTLSIGYDGAVLESYPAQFNAQTIVVTEETDDKISLYAQALRHIYEDGERMDSEKTIFLDLTKLTSLSDGQKNALAYVMSNYYHTKTEADVVRSSYEELESQGRLKDGAIKDGVIFSVKDSESKKGAFAVSQWWGPLGASGFGECTAKFKDGAWSINYGGAWIS